MVESLKSINFEMVESLFFRCCSCCEMVGNVKRLMEVTPRSIFSSCVILFCPQAQAPWRSLDRWRGKTSFLFSLRHCLRGARTSKTICKNTISASDNQSTHQVIFSQYDTRTCLSLQCYPFFIFGLCSSTKSTKNCQSIVKTDNQVTDDCR